MARDSVCKYKFTVEKHGRKWTQVVIHYASGKNGKAKVLKESVADVEAGQTVERNGKLDIQSTRYGTTVELILLSDSEVQDAKEAERQAFIDKWWGYFLDSFEKGYYYQRAVSELHALNCHDKDEEIERCKQEVERKKREEKEKIMGRTLNDVSLRMFDDTLEKWQEFIKDKEYGVLLLDEALREYMRNKERQE